MPVADGPDQVPLQITQFGSVIGFRLLRNIVLFSSLLTLIATLTQLGFDYWRDVSSIETRMAEIARSDLDAIVRGLWYYDANQLRLQLEGIRHLPDIQRVEVRTLPGAVTPFSLVAGDREHVSIIAHEYPLVQVTDGKPQQIGILRIEANLTAVYLRLLNTTALILINNAIKTFLVSIFTLYIVHRLVTRHLTSISKFLDHYSPEQMTPVLALRRKRNDRQDELDRMVTSFNQMADGLRRAYQALHDANAELKLDNAARRRAEEETARLNAVLERRVAERTAELSRSLETIEEQRTQVARLLDNSGEGFLSFGDDLVIAPQYSRACESLLGAVPAGRDAAELLFAHDERSANLLRQIVPSALRATDPTRRDLILSLLPADFSRETSRLKAQYTVIDNGHVMVVLSDATEERRLAEMAEGERHRLQMIVAAVTDSRDFFDAVEAFRTFGTVDLPALLAATAPLASVIDEIFRHIHTFKGLLAQFSFRQTPRALHELERGLGDLRSKAATASPDDLAEVVRSVPFGDAFDQDLDTLRDALGDDFVRVGDRVTLSAAQVQKLEDMASRLLRGEPVAFSAPPYRALLQDLATLRKIRIRDVLGSFDRVTSQAAERLEKAVAPLIVEGGDDLRIDPEIYRPFLRSLVHVFRNAVVHGIEDPETRVRAGKAEAGTVTCSVADDGSTIRLTIADDGAGIDLAALRRKGEALGLIGATSSADEVQELIFVGSVSTQQNADELAGRGVGMASVRAAVNDLGGTVAVQSVAGQGTRFCFTLPRRDHPVA
jgi:two-component system chemotaxis sensor kinase CheA